MRSSRGVRASRSTSSTASMWFLQWLMRWTTEAGVVCRSSMSSSRMASLTMLNRSSSS